MTGSLYSIDDFGEGSTMELKNIILPAFTLGIRPLSVVVQLARSSFLDVLSQDFIRTARAKGLSNRAVLINHALRNAMNPVVTAVSGWFAGLLAGAVFIEYIFGWKGLGKEIVDALENYDFPVVMGGVLVISLAFVIINILVDIIYGVLDPRVSLR
jgi:peptide/nickel transport system permease protein